jgi:hypothetical protein
LQFHFPTWLPISLSLLLSLSMIIAPQHPGIYCCLLHFTLSHGSLPQASISPSFLIKWFACQVSELCDYSTDLCHQEESKSVFLIIQTPSTFYCLSKNT